MRVLDVWIEINGSGRKVGSISGSHPSDAVFCYATDYLGDAGARPVSVSLPLQEKPFSPAQTKNFFEGLLPEGFTRRSVAQWMHVDENDYLSILSGLGRECLGALQIVEEGKPQTESSYEKLTSERVLALAKEGTTASAELVIKAHLSLTGASGKVGLYLNEKENAWYLPRGSAPSTHILKQSHVRLLDIVANEQLCLMTAKNLGLDVPDSFIVDTGSDSSEDVLFASRRFDRVFSENSRYISGMKVPGRLHQEDFAQALGIPASGKYETVRQGYVKKMFDLLRNWSSNPMQDQLKLWDTIVFDYLIGNTDSHLKNFSLLYSEDLKSIRMAPAYDILSTSVYEGTTRELSFFIGSENRLEHITRASFEEAAKEAGIRVKMAMDRFDQMKEALPGALALAAEQLSSQGISHAQQLRQRIVKQNCNEIETKP